MFRSSSVSTRSLQCHCHRPPAHGKDDRSEDARVPDHTAVLDANFVKALVDITYLRNALVEGALCPEHGCVRLHSLLHRKPDLGCWLRAIRIANLIKEGNTFMARLLRYDLVRFSGSESVFDVVSTRTSEDHDIE